jgi:hypothetical protein
MPNADWRLEGQWLKTCNCARGCPCNFNGKPTQGNCVGVIGMCIVKGHFDGTRPAGIYQRTPLKHTCLRHCRSPLVFVMTHWRPGAAGAWSMGLRHGADCVGCCWLLMLLLFVGGVMNVAWIAGIALFVLVEKFVPAGRWIGRPSAPCWSSGAPPPCSPHPEPPHQRPHPRHDESYETVLRGKGGRTMRVWATALGC